MVENLKRIKWGKKAEGIPLHDLAGAQINLGIRVTQCVKDRGLDVKDKAERWSYWNILGVRKKWGAGWWMKRNENQQQKKKSPHGGAAIIERRKKVK